MLSGWREPQLRYLLADIRMGGSDQLYRRYAAEGKDPDSIEAIPYGADIIPS